MSLELAKLLVELLGPVGGVLLFAWHQSRSGGVTAQRMQTNEDDTKVAMAAATDYGIFKGRQEERNKNQESFNERIDREQRELR